MGIKKTPGVIGGDACIGDTRIAVWMLEVYRRLGVTDARLLENYPTLQDTDLTNAWAYVEANKVEIDEAIQASEIA